MCVSVATYKYLHDKMRNAVEEYVPCARLMPILDYIPEAWIRLELGTSFLVRSIKGIKSMNTFLVSRFSVEFVVFLPPPPPGAVTGG